MIPAIRKFIADTRTLCDAATPGPWDAHKNKYQTEFHQLVVQTKHPSRRVIAYFHANEESDDEDDANTTFIASSRTSLPAALDALEKAVIEIQQTASCSACATCRMGAKFALAAVAEKLGVKP